MSRYVYTIQPHDVGRRTLPLDGRRTSIADFLGEVQPGDVGKRIDKSGDVYQVENDEQVSARMRAKNPPRFFVTVHGRRKYFATFDAAQAAASAVFRKTGIVLGIESTGAGPHGPKGTLGEWVPDPSPTAKARRNPFVVEAGDRVEISPRFDLWMRGDRYGTVVKHSKLGVYVKMDKTGKTLRYAPNDLTFIERKRNPSRHHANRIRVARKRNAMGYKERSDFPWDRLRQQDIFGNVDRVDFRPSVGSAAWLSKKPGYVRAEVQKALSRLTDQQFLFHVLGHRVKDWLPAKTVTRKRNPLLGVLGNPGRGELFGADVLAIVYRHASDGSFRIHSFSDAVRDTIRGRRFTVTAPANARSGVTMYWLGGGRVELRGVDVRDYPAES